MYDIAFALIIGIGVTLGLVWAVLRDESEMASTVLNAGIFSLFGAYLGSRFAFIAVNSAYFRSYPEELWLLPVGGFAWPGALLGGIIGLLVFALLVGKPLGKLADALLPLLATISVSGWVACWITGCAYGAPVESWWGLLARDEWGILSRRWPVQPMGAILSLGIIWLIDQLPLSKFPPGLGFLLGILGICLVNFFMSLVRIDPAPFLSGLRLDAWIALVFGSIALTSLIAVMISNRNKKKTHADMKVKPPGTS